MIKGFLALLMALMASISLVAQERVFPLESFNRQTGFVGESANALEIDAHSRLWVGTETGLYLSDGTNWKQIIPLSNQKKKGQMPCTHITALLFIGEDSLLIGTYNCGAYLFLTEREELQAIPIIPEAGKTLENRVLSLYSNGTSPVWVGLNDPGLYRFNPNAFQIEPVSTAGESPSLCHDFYQAKTGDSLWVAANNGFYLGLPPYTSFQKLSWAQGKQANSYEQLFHAVDRKANGDFILGTWGAGFATYAPATNLWEYHLLKDGPLHGGSNIVRDIVWQSKNDVWIASGDQGLVHYDEEKNQLRYLSKERHKDPLEWEYCRRLLHTPKAIYCASDHGVLAYFRSWPSLTTYSFPAAKRTPSKALHVPVDMVHDANLAGYWVVFHESDGIGFMDEKSGKTRMIELESQDANPIIYGKNILSINGDEWLFVHAHGAYIIDGLNKKPSPFSLPKELAEAYILRAFQSKSERFYFLTSGQGIWEYNPALKQWKHFGAKQGIHPSNQYYAVAEDPIGILWIAMDNEGLLRFNPTNGAVSKWDQKRHPELLGVFDIEIDHSNRAWIRTAFGLFSFLPSEEELKLYSPQHQIKANIYDIQVVDNYLYVYHSDGLQRINLAGDSSILFPFAHGFPSRLDDWSILMPANSHLFIGYTNHIMDIDIKNWKSKAKRTYKLKWEQHVNWITSNSGERKFTVEAGTPMLFGSLQRIPADLSEKFQFEYRLLEQDSAWIPLSLGGSEFRLNQLMAGEYNLEIRGHYLGNYPYDYHEKIRFSIAQFWWKSKWFYAGLLALAVFLFVFYYRFKLKQVNEKRTWENRLNELENQAMRAQMNPHFLFNSLNSVNYFIQSNDKVKASFYLKKFAKLVRMILANSRLETITLEAEIDALRLYMELEQMRFENKLNIEIQIEEAIPIHDIAIPPLLLQPFVENAIWHGIMQKESNGTVRVSIRSVPKGYLFCIEDDGIGRAKAAELKSKSAQKEKSLGIGLSQERMLNFNKRQSQATLNVEIIDSQENGTTGTRVEISYYESDEN